MNFTSRSPNRDLGTSSHPGPVGPSLGTTCKKPMSIALVNMPFAAAERPSIQCGLLKSLLTRSGYRVKTYYINLQFSKLIGPSNYFQLSDGRWLSFLGEWLFAEQAFHSSLRCDKYIEEYRQKDDWHRVALSSSDLQQLRDRTIPDFLDALAIEPGWAEHQIVGFTCTFDQQVPSFALARKLKELHPHITTLFGGATFDADNAAEFVHKLWFVDYVLLGEADESLPLLVEQMSQGRYPLHVPGLVSKSTVNGQSSFVPGRLATDLESIPDPDYDEYFATLTDVGSEVLCSRTPQIPFQAARGCWWGAKYHCTFCSLKDEEMSYRSRPAGAVAGEIVRQASRYQQLRFTSADSILDMKYIDRFFPLLMEQQIDATFFYEVKANLTKAQLQQLAKGGVTVIQAGIESLSSHLLDLMKKGTNRLLNVRLLKWARFYGINVAWNILAGFPGETCEDYSAQAELVPWLVHLQPPSGTDIIMLEKHAPYGTMRHPWYRDRHPLRAYEYLYPSHLIDIAKVAQYFDFLPSHPTGVPEAIARLKGATEHWRRLWDQPLKPRLTYQRGPDWSIVVDTRHPDLTVRYPLNAIQTKVLEACADAPTKVDMIVKIVSAKEGGSMAPTQVSEICCELAERRLLIEDDGRFLSLPLPARREWSTAGAA
jgi:ribosomal peptide maturation radical SAM protein 1